MSEKIYKLSENVRNIESSLSDASIYQLRNVVNTMKMKAIDFIKQTKRKVDMLEEIEVVLEEFEVCQYEFYQIQEDVMSDKTNINDMTLQELEVNMIINCI